MKKITNELKAKLHKDLLPIAISLKQGGVPDCDIDRIIEKHLAEKKGKFYKKNPFRVGDPVKNIGGDLKKAMRYMELNVADSRAEVVFFRMLKEHGIPFDFQVDIGPYRVDYLIANYIVFEGDGPQHDLQKKYDEKRDKYLTIQGYEVMRIKWDLVAVIGDELVLSIKRQLQKYKII